MNLTGYYDPPEEAAEPDPEDAHAAELERQADRHDIGYHEWAGQE